MITKAAVLYELNSPLVVEELELPELGYGQVLVRIAYSGICRNQLNEIRGRRGEDPYLPHTLGHEASGIVAALGPGVTKVNVGDHVVLSWIKGKGYDIPRCTYHKGNLKVNSGAISTFGEYSVVSENRVTAIPKDMPLDIAALLGCCVPTGFGTVFNQVKPGSSIAIFGVGGVGLCTLMAAGLMGCSPIIAIDVQPSKLEMARNLGATHLINTRYRGPLSRILNISGKGVDYAIEAAGERAAMEQAYKSIHDRGVALIAGNLARGKKISIDPFDLIQGKRIVGSWGGGTNPDKDIPHYVKLYLSGKINLGSLISHRYSLEAINDALAPFEAGQTAKVLIEMGDSNNA